MIFFSESTSYRSSQNCSCKDLRSGIGDWDVCNEPNFLLSMFFVRNETYFEFNQTLEIAASSVKTMLNETNEYGENDEYINHLFYPPALETFG